MVLELNVEYYFKYAEINSTRYELWQYINEHYNNSEIIVPVSLNSFLSYGVSLFKRGTAVILDSLLFKTLQVSACSFRARDTDSLYSLTVKIEQGDDLLERARTFIFHYLIDPSEKNMPKGLVLNQHFIGKSGKFMRKILRRSIEGGLQFSKLREVQTKDVFNIMDTTPQGRKDPEKSHLVRDCMSDTIVSPAASIVSHIDLINIAKLYFVCLALLVVCLVLLILESTKQKPSPSKI